MTLELTRADAARVLASLAAAVAGSAPEELDSLARLELAVAAGTFFGLDATGHEEVLLRGRSVDEWAQTTLEGWAAGPRELTFSTSGTTAEPTLCVHPWATVAQELEALAAVVGDGRRRVVGLVPHHHIYGFLFCVLLPRRLGLPFHDARAAGLAALAPGDLAIGFPLRWELAARAFPADVHGVSSTAPLDPAVADRLAELGLARMVEVYGSSQTGGVGWRDAPHGPYERFAHWRLEADGTLVRADPERPGARLAPVAAPDRLVRAGADRFTVAGRHDGVVQVGGVNVSCERIAGVLRTHPGVRDCAVRPMTRAEGRRLKAFVVCDGPPVAGLRGWLEASLSAPERPTSLTFGTTLPRDAQGKPADWPLGYG